MKGSVFSTEKQIKFAKAIRDVLELPIKDKAFEIMTKWQISEFISTNLKDFNEEKECYYRYRGVGDDRDGQNVISYLYFDYEADFLDDMAWGIGE